jgi:hypothetical protein
MQPEVAQAQADGFKQEAHAWFLRIAIFGASVLCLEPLG